MDAAAQPAAGAGDDGFLTDDFSERDDAIGYEFRVLDEVGRVADGAGDKDFSGGRFDVPPDFEFKFEISGQVLNRGVVRSLLTVE